MGGEWWAPDSVHTDTSQGFLPFAGYIGRMQATNFFPFVGSFSPCGAKRTYRRRKSTMLPQARSAFT
jgi:hypothetical protein